MKGFQKEIEIFRTISDCLKDYDKNLKNKKVMFIIENKDKSLDKDEVFFPKSSYYHLTGIILLDNKKQKVNSYEFYDLLKNERLNMDKYTIQIRNNAADLKLKVLPQLMKIDKMANMIGNFSNHNIFLQTEKVAGNINACMGFVKDFKSDMYVPNTALQEDIRDITDNRNKIIAILKKEKNESLYRNITYLKKNYQISDILKNESINKSIDIQKLYSENSNIKERIQNFLNNF